MTGSKAKFEKLMLAISGPYGRYALKKLPFESVTLNLDGSTHHSPNATHASFTRDGHVLAFSRYEAEDEAIRHGRLMHQLKFWQHSGYTVIGKSNLMLAIRRLSRGGRRGLPKQDYVWGVTRDGVVGLPIFDE